MQIELRFMYCSTFSHFFHLTFSWVVMPQAVCLWLCHMMNNVVSGLHDINMALFSGRYSIKLTFFNDCGRGGRRPNWLKRLTKRRAMIYLKLG